MKPAKIIVKTKNKNYPIIIGNNLINRFSNIIKKNSLNFNQCLLVVDDNVPKKFINQILLAAKY